MFILNEWCAAICVELIQKGRDTITFRFSQGSNCSLLFCFVIFLWKNKLNWKKKKKKINLVCEINTCQGRESKYICRLNLFSSNGGWRKIDNYFCFVSRGVLVICLLFFSNYLSSKSACAVELNFIFFFCFLGYLNQFVTIQILLNCRKWHLPFFSPFSLSTLVADRFVGERR
jgi:hypothetical protein